MSGLLKFIFNLVGLSSVFASVFICVVMFYDIALFGSFRAYETNMFVLGFEIGLICFSFVYLVYLLVWFICSSVILLNNYRDKQ